MEQLVFHILKNAESKYGLKKSALIGNITAHNPFGNLKEHSITSINMLTSVKDAVKHRIQVLQEEMKKNFNERKNSKQREELNKQMAELENLIN